MTAAAQPAGQPPVAPADPAAADAWRLLVMRLRGEDSATWRPSAATGLHLGKVAGWLATICASEMAGREHDQGAGWKDAFAAAQRTAAERLEAAEKAPDMAALKELIRPAARPRAPGTVRVPRRAQRRR